MVTLCLIRENLCHLWTTAFSRVIPDQNVGVGAENATSNTQQPRCVAMLSSLMVLLTALPFSATASTQDVTVSAGSIPREMHCPNYNRSAHSRAARPQEDVFAVPENEELAELPIRGEAYSQDIYLGERKVTDPSKPFSIGFWGDSHAASGYFSEELLRALELSPDMVQPTFIPPTMDRSGVRLPIHKYCQSRGWSYEYAYNANHTNADFAKGLVNLKSTVPQSYLWVDFRRHPHIANLRALDLLYVPPLRGKKTLVGIRADEGAESIVELNAEGDGVMHIHAERPIAIIKLRLIAGTLALQGFVPQYVEKPALYLDTLGVPGATVRGWKALNTAHLKRRDNHIAYDLVILEYGTNEGNDLKLDLDRYIADLRASLKNMRQMYPDSLCVLMGPTDRGVLVKRASRRKRQYATTPPKSLLHYAQAHHQLSLIQTAIGKEYSCAFWSWQNAMGGPGGAYSWLRHSPALIAKDLTHLSVPGYQLSARKFVADTNLTNYVRPR